MDGCATQWRVVRCSPASLRALPCLLVFARVVANRAIWAGALLCCALLCFDASTTEASNFGVAEKTTTHKMVEGVRGDAAGGRSCAGAREPCKGTKRGAVGDLTGRLIGGSPGSMRWSALQEVEGSGCNSPNFTGHPSAGRWEGSARLPGLSPQTRPLRESEALMRQGG
jgi:hypothetical protein